MKIVSKTTRSLFLGLFLLVFSAPQAIAQGGWRSIRQDYWPCSFSSVFFLPDGQSGWAVGSRTIAHTANGGATWGSQTSSTSNYLESVFFIDANHGWAVGNYGIVLKYTNNTGITTK